MKVTIALFVAFLFSFSTFGVAFSDEWVNGYTRRDGTYVEGHYRSNRDGNPYNNYSTKGNVNPYTGEKGYNDPNTSFSKPYKINPYNLNQFSSPKPQRDPYNFNQFDSNK